MSPLGLGPTAKLMSLMTLAWLRLLGMSAKDCHEASLKSSSPPGRPNCCPAGPRGRTFWRPRPPGPTSFLNWQVPQSRAGGTGCVGDKICLREDSDGTVK